MDMPLMEVLVVLVADFEADEVIDAPIAIVIVVSCPLTVSVITSRVAVVNLPLTVSVVVIIDIGAIDVVEDVPVLTVEVD